MAMVICSYSQVRTTQHLYASAGNFKIADFSVQTETPLPPGLRRKNIGTAMTIGGAVLVVGGIAMVSSADALYYNYSTGSNGTYDEGDPKGALGILMITGGVGLIIPGLILWSKGGKRYKQYLEEQQELSLNMTGSGISLRLKL